MLHTWEGDSCRQNFIRCELVTPGVDSTCTFLCPCGHRAQPQCTVTLIDTALLHTQQVEKICEVGFATVLEEEQALEELDARETTSTVNPATSDSTSLGSIPDFDPPEDLQPNNEMDVL